MKKWIFNLLCLFISGLFVQAADSYSSGIQYDRSNGNVSPGQQGIYNFKGGVRHNRYYLTGTTPALSWKTNEYAITLSGNTTFTFSDTPTDTNIVARIKLLVVGNGSYTFTTSEDVTYLSPMYVPKNGTNEYIFEWNSGVITAKMERPLEIASFTIFDPDGVQSVSDAVPLLAVESTWAPNGITIINIYLKTDAASTYSLDLEEWTAMVSGTVTLIETVATSSSSEATDDGTLSDSSIAAGSIIFADLPATAANYINITFTFKINEG